VIAFHHNGFDYRGGVGRWPNGQVSEVFLDCTKLGTMADTMARDSAVVASIALQCGANLDTLRRALIRDASGNACGPLGALLDLVSEGDDL